MYCDIDVHHGDGVEEAFLYNNRVLTYSIHQYGEDFFPKTGSLNQHHSLSNIYDSYALNVPLKEGCTDETFNSIFKLTFDRAFESYKPEVIVL